MSNAMSECWTIYIDLEGFSALWDKENQILGSLCELIPAIFRVGDSAIRTLLIAYLRISSEMAF